MAAPMTPAQYTVGRKGAVVLRGNGRSVYVSPILSGSRERSQLQGLIYNQVVFHLDNFIYCAPG